MMSYLLHVKSISALVRPFLGKCVRPITNQKSPVCGVMINDISYNRVLAEQEDLRLKEVPILSRPKQLKGNSGFRLGFIPEESFQFFYSKTGVTGPYLFGIGLTTFLASKEIFLYEPFLIMATIGVIQNIISADRALLREEELKQRDSEVIKAKEKAIKIEKESQLQAESAIALVELKRETIKLQIELANREALHAFHLDVMRRLEYMKECHRIQQSYLRKNMVQWVVANVLKSLPPMPKEDLEKIAKDVSASCMKIC